MRCLASRHRRPVPIRKPTDTMLKRFITHLPTKLSGRILGGLLYFFAISRRRIGRRNLRFAFPEASPQWIRRTAWDVAQNYGITMVEMIQLMFFSRDQVLSRVKLHGLDQLSAESFPAEAESILVSAHMGNWEIGMQALPCLFDMNLTAVAKKFK